MACRRQSDKKPTIDRPMRGRQPFCVRPERERLARSRLFRMRFEEPFQIVFGDAERG